MMTKIFKALCLPLLERTFNMFRMIFTLVLGSLITAQTNLVLAQNADALWQAYSEEGAINNNLPDFSYAGFFAMASRNQQAHDILFNVLDFGAIPNDDVYDGESIQKAIDAASGNGGGTVFLPQGVYLLKGGEPENILRISTSNIILRGESARGENASILFLENPSSGDTIGSAIGQTQDDMRRIAAIAIEGEPDNTILTTFIDQDLPRGTRIIPVENTNTLRPHQTIRISLSDPLVNEEEANKDQAELVKLMTTPFEFTGIETKTLGRHGKGFEYITKIRRVIDDTHIELYQPLRFEHFARHSPTIKTFGGIDNVGIEQLRIDSAWLGGFVHHQAYPTNSTGDNIIRTELEQDYGWVGIWGSWLEESWINDVVINNFTQNIILSNSAFVTVSNMRLEGSGGHAGFTYSSVYSILTNKVHFAGPFVHPVSVRAWASGNVFSDIKTDHYSYDSVSRTGPFIDFHGLYSYENLFENFEGFYVHSGGDLDVLPHSGVRNIFWNLETPEIIERFSYAKGEFFNTTTTQVNKMYEQHPASVLVGVYGKNNSVVKINRVEQNRLEPFVQTYNLNQNSVPVESLFQAQAALRKSQNPLPPEAPVLTID